VNQKSALEQAKELLKAAKDNPQQFQELTKARPSKPKKVIPDDMNQRKAMLRDGKITKEEYAQPVGGQISGESTTGGYPSEEAKKQEISGDKPGAGYPSDKMKKDTMNPAGEAQGGQCGPDNSKGGYPSEQMKKDAMGMQPQKPGAAPAAKPAPMPQPVKKDDKPHPAGSPPAQAHNVAEGDESLHHAMKILDTPDKQKSMLAHLRTLHEPSQQRSPANRQAGGMPPQKPNAAPQRPPMQKADMPGTSTAGAGAAGVPLAMTEALKHAKELLKAAKDDPKRFAELRKMSSVAGLATSEKKTAKTSEMSLAMAETQPNPNPMSAEQISPSTGVKTGGAKDPNSATQPKTAEQISPSTSVKPGGAKDPNSATQPMTAEQINASSTKKGEMSTKKCGTMMSKDEIKEDLKQDWKPKHWKKDC
jgi:hypothetical protein